MKNKVILEICLSPDAGGLELYMVKLSHFLHTKTEVISVISNSGSLEKYYEGSDYKYEKLQKRSTLLSWISARKLAKIIDENNVDLIHLHWTKDLLICVLAKLISKRKVKIVQSRHMTMTRFKDDFYHRFIYKNIDMIVAVTKQVKEQIHKFLPQDVSPVVKTIYIGAEIPQTIDELQKQALKTKYSLENSFVVGIVGRIEKAKGQYLVLQALQKLLSEGIDAKLLIVGHAMDAIYLQELQKEIVQNKMTKNVIFTGFSSEVQELMQVCDTIVLATNKETFGLVLIEAMASNIAVVASNSGGPLEIIEDKVSGLLFETNDSESLMECLKELLDTKLRTKISLSGQQRAKKMFESQKQFEELFVCLNTID